MTTTSTPPAVDDAAWGSPAPTAWTLEAEGSTTLWAWAKDSANVISPAKSASILYSTATPAVSNVIARGTTDGTVAIRWDTDVPAVGSVNYRVNGGGWQVSPAELQPVTSHLRVISGVFLGDSIDYYLTNNEIDTAHYSYAVETLVEEIPKSQMTASAGNTDATAYQGIDGNTASWWQAGNAPTWYRVDLGARYRVLRLGYQPRVADHAFYNYQIYLTNDSSTVQANWGSPVLAGTFGYVSTRTDLDLRGEGRYLIIYGERFLNGPTVAELWVYGDRLDAVIDSFSVADRTSGATGITNEATVNVTLTAHALEGSPAIDGYMVTESATAPLPDDPEWQPTAPATYDITSVDPPDYAALYGWVRVADGGVAGAAVTIYYNPMVPVISDIQIYPTSDSVAIVSWRTDIDAVGRVRYHEEGIAEQFATDWETTAGTSHWRVITGLTLDFPYIIIVDSNEVSSPEQTYLHENPVPELSKTGWGASAYKSQASYPPELGIDGNVASWWQSDTTPCWFRIDLGARYRIQRLTYLPRDNNHSFRNYEIYVTDSAAGNISPAAINKPAEWGAPAATGQFPFATNVTTTVDLLGYGR